MTRLTTVTTFVRAPSPDNAKAVIRVVRRRLFGPSRGPRFDRLPEGRAPETQIVVYFAEDRRRIYQLDQWLPVLETLHEQHPVLLVMRKLPAYNEILERTDLPAVYVRRLPDLAQLYDEIDPKVGIYVNNGMANFQSLAYPTMLHVHVNHGESDKISMVSNQAKAYDRVFVAGEAAERRHAAALIGFDPGRLVRVGRPQLDLEFDPALPQSTRRTVIYAPTWEGESDFNNYTSVDVYGVRIVRQLLALDDVRVVYRPHPRVATSTVPEIVAAHGEILALLAAAARLYPDAGHCSAMEGSILALFAQCDAMVTDVSSVGLDFLYLRTDKPLLLTDRRDDRTQLAVDAPISAAADVVDAGTIDEVGAVVAARLSDDVLAQRRQELRQFYFGELQPGESTERFLAEVRAVMARRDELVAQLPHREHPAAVVSTAMDMAEEEAEARFEAEGSLTTSTEGTPVG